MSELPKYLLFISKVLPFKCKRLVPFPGKIVEQYSGGLVSVGDLLGSSQEDSGLRGRIRFDS